MTHLISAELLRLRALRSPRYVALGALALLAVLAAMPAIAPAAGPPPGTAEVTEGLRVLALMGILLAAAFAASTVGTDAARGGTAMTYLAHPGRAGVTAARALTYAGLGLAFAAASAGIVTAVGLHVAAAQGAGPGPSGGALARLLLGACAGGAALGAAGALVGTAARNATVASGALVGWHLGESLLGVAGVGPYLPFGLLASLMGRGDEVAALPAAALLAAYVAALAAAVLAWAVPRDLT
jgi:hypothetical protein